jgi:hypothetical protein
VTFNMDKHSGGIFSCDECPETLDCEGRRDFNECQEYLKSKGWRTFKGPDGKYANACPCCVHDFGRRQER